MYHYTTAYKLMRISALDISSQSFRIPFQSVYVSDRDSDRMKVDIILLQ